MVPRGAGGSSAKSDNPAPPRYSVAEPSARNGTMHPAYAIQNVADVFTPALVFYKDLIRANIAEVIRLAGSPRRLCPHVKTHKCREIVRLQLDAAITTHK